MPHTRSLADFLPASDFPATSRNRVFTSHTTILPAHAAASCHAAHSRSRRGLSTLRLGVTRHRSRRPLNVAPCAPRPRRWYPIPYAHVCLQFVSRAVCRYCFPKEPNSWNSPREPPQVPQSFIAAENFLFYRLIAACGTHMILIFLLRGLPRGTLLLEGFWDLFGSSR